jgi:hypothetical protein
MTDTQVTVLPTEYKKDSADKDKDEISARWPMNQSDAEETSPLAGILIINDDCLMPEMTGFALNQKIKVRWELLEVVALDLVLRRHLVRAAKFLAVAEEHGIEIKDV